MYLPTYLANFKIKGRVRGNIDIINDGLIFFFLAKQQISNFYKCLKNVEI